MRGIPLPWDYAEDGTPLYSTRRDARVAQTVQRGLVDPLVEYYYYGDPQDGSGRPVVRRLASDPPETALRRVWSEYSLVVYAVAGVAVVYGLFLR